MYVDSWGADHSELDPCSFTDRIASGSAVTTNVASNDLPGSVGKNVTGSRTNRPALCDKNNYKNIYLGTADVNVSNI